MKRKTAIGVETSVWKNLVINLYRSGWVVKEKYVNVDAGVDFDFLILKKKGKSIWFGWDYIDEGEIKTDEYTFALIQEKFDLKLKFGAPSNLVPKIIFLTRLFTLPGRFSSNPKKFFKEQFGLTK
ncbi:hypothetical protein [Roseivirga pacifica]|uniref:hypothetical protein n=1 Tax=Roseivirga pacifica TaxID=1267423 RepID=UPI003BAF51B5